MGKYILILGLIHKSLISSFAAMVELVDTLVLGTSAYGVGVRLPLAAHIYKIKHRELLICIDT